VVLFTGRIPEGRASVFRLLSGDFEVFLLQKRPFGAHGVKFGVEEQPSTLPRQISPHRLQGWGTGLQSCKFYEIWDTPLSDSYEIFRVRDFVFVGGTVFDPWIKFWCG